MKLTGEQFGMLRDALNDAFNRQALRAMVRIRLDEDLDVIVSDQPYLDQLEELIRWAERNEKVEALIEGASAENPSNKNLAAASEAILASISGSEDSAFDGELVARPTDQTAEAFEPASELDEWLKEGVQKTDGEATDEVRSGRVDEGKTGRRENGGSIEVIGLIIAVFLGGLAVGLLGPRVIEAIRKASDSTELDSTSIEDFPGRIFDFEGEGGYGWLNVIRAEDGDLDYQLSYEIPQDNGDAYAGIFFDFAPTRDLTEFSSIQVEMSFGDGNTICQVYLQDQNDIRNYITMGVNEFSASGDARTEASGAGKVFTIPLAENFPEPNRQSIDGIGISVSGGFINGAHTCIVHDILLLN
jgi:hypothetical protein